MKLLFIIVAVISGIYSSIINLVTYKSADKPTPKSVSDVYDAQTYAKWKKYNAENCRLSAISTAVSLVITIALLTTNAYSAFAALFPAGMFMQLLAVIILETAIGTVIGTIFSYVGTMKIEEKYGFNRSTKKTFITDKIRGLIIELLLSVALAYLLATIHTGMGDMMIVLFTAAVFAITLLISFLYPFFSRIGNKFTPLEEGELKDKLMELLTKHGYRVRAIEVMDASRRTTKLNAYFTGFGKLKTIVLYDNLVNNMEPDEICAVFAHELGHGLHKDVLKGQILSYAKDLTF